MSPNLQGISCIIPVHNEQGALSEVIKGSERALRESGNPFEIIVVDDASTDGTAAAIRDSGVPHTVIRHDMNRGYGASIKTGCRRASHPWILIIDGDGSYPPEEIAALLKKLGEDESADMIVGARSQTTRTDGIFRLAAKAILRALAQFLSGREIPDINSGLRLMRKSLVERYWPLLPDGFSLTTSITLALLCSGFTVRYLPIEYRKREGHSKIRPLPDMWTFTKLIVRTMVYFNPLKVFIPLSVFLVIAAFATVILSKVITHRVMDVTSLFLFIAGLQMLLIGVIADLVMKTTGMRDR
ncbi:glycosyltransferase family 2 protein [Candidatus Sumerlaeota bacterium]|nr:glycosyltransferase family 2 protein [Candidatus Sumerlaeota bacterium]MBI3735068.1 glycosyltransferase family 2 protein [Candidatus Sumerlaeota bacterium]